MFAALQIISVVFKNAQNLENSTFSVVLLLKANNNIEKKKKDTHQFLRPSQHILLHHCKIKMHQSLIGQG